jgi:hypothetical protein
MKIELKGVAYTIDDNAQSVMVRLPGGLKSLKLDGLSQEQIQKEVDKWIEEDIKTIQ